MKIALLEKIKTLYKGIKRKMAKEVLNNDKNGLKYLNKLTTLYVFNDSGNMLSYKTITKNIEEDIPLIYVLDETGKSFVLKKVTDIEGMISYDTCFDRITILAKFISQIASYQKTLDNQTKMLDVVNKDLDKANADLLSIKAALVKVETELYKSDTKVIDLKVELAGLDKLKINLEEKLKETEKGLELAHSVNRTNIAELTDQIDKIKNEYKKTEDALQESENEVRVLNETLDSVKTELKEAYTKKTDLESNLEVVTVANSTLQDKIDDLVKDQASKAAEIEGLKTLNQSLNAKIEEMQSNSSELTRELISELDTFTNKITGIIAKI